MKSAPKNHHLANRASGASDRAQLVELLSPRLAEAQALASTLGILKLPSGKPPQPINFALIPSPICPEISEQLTRLTPHFNRLIHAIAQDHSFLAEISTATQDPFIQRLLTLLPTCKKPRKLYLNRHDFLIAPIRDSAGFCQETPQLVEINTHAVGYIALASRTQQLYSSLLHNTAWSDLLVDNPCLKQTALLLANAFHKCDGKNNSKNSCFLLVGQPDETNLADQYLLAEELKQLDVPVIKKTLADICQQGSLKNGHLWLAKTRVAIAYLRSGYSPADLAPQDAWRGRELLANSSAIEVPDIAGQLAGLKKVQQELCQPAVLKHFMPLCPPQMLATLTPMYKLDEVLADGTPAWQHAIEHSDQFVLKPQREGGGNSLFDQPLVQKLRELTPQARNAWVLMHKIMPTTHQTVLASPRGLPSPLVAISEIGRFGLLLTEGQQELINQDTGFLVRTKPSHYNEGGISSGFGALDSLIYQPPQNA